MRNVYADVCAGTTTAADTTRVTNTTESTTVATVSPDVKGQPLATDNYAQ